MDKGYPLILVFYLDREMMKVPKIIRPYVDAVNEAIAKREANAMAFFLPTDDKERIECINPVTVDDAEMEKIMSMVNDIENNFDIGQGADDGKNDPENIVKVEETEKVEEVIPEYMSDYNTMKKHFESMGLKVDEPFHRGEWNYLGWQTNEPLEKAYTQKDWNQTLHTMVNKVSKEIHQETGNGGVKFIYANPSIEELFLTMGYYNSTVNKLMGINVIFDKSIPEDELLCLGDVDRIIKCKEDKSECIMIYPEKKVSENGGDYGTINFNTLNIKEDIEKANDRFSKHFSVIKIKNISKGE